MNCGAVLVDREIKYCLRHRDDAKRLGARKRMGYGEHVVDNWRVTGNTGSKIFWVNVLECPRDDPSDDLPPFQPKFSRFPIQQFTAGLTEGIWPVGMKVQLTLLGYTEDRDGKHRHEQKLQYVIPKGTMEQKLLSGQMLADSKRFAKRVWEK